MDATHADSTSAERHEYRPVGYGRWLLKLLPWLLLLLSLPLIDVFILHDPDPRGGWVMTAFTLSVALLAVAALGYFQTYAVWKMRLITMPQGILFHGPGYRIYAPWDALVGLEKMTRSDPVPIGMIFIPTTGVTFQPPTQAMSLDEARERRRPAIEAINPRNAGQYRFSRATMIPIGYFVRDWESDPLAQDMRRYAPQVFDTPNR